jgi:hypothetical protein
MNPLLVKYKVALIVAAFGATATAGWAANGWRLGKKLAAQESKYFQARARRGEEYADTLVQAARTASARIEEAQVILDQARAFKAKALRDTAAKAPTSPEFQCLDKPLPETYLETFRATP